MILTLLNSRPRLLKAYLILAIVEGFVSIIYLALIPADSKTAVIFGYSWTRLFLLGGILIFLISLFTIWIYVTNSTGKWENAVRFTDSIFLDKTKLSFLISSTALVVTLGISTLLVPAERLEGGIYIFQRLLPVIFLMILLGIQTLIGQFVWREKKLHFENLRVNKRSALYIFSPIFLVVFLMVGFVIWSGIGLIPDRSGWYSPGTPLLFSQILFSGALAVSVIRFGKSSGWINENESSRDGYFDIVLCILLWLIAFAFWWATPMNKWSYFTSAPTPPNYEYYPYSDAAIYDGAAQNIIIGTSRNGDVMLRPLYSFFLALLHVIGGQNYQQVVLLQVFVLAISPALIYLIGSKIGGRYVGLFAGSLIILRERNSIALTNIIEVSHTKLLLSDVPAMTLILVFVYLLMIWFGQNRVRPLGVFAGAALGLVVLVRSQAQLLLPVVFMILILVEKFYWKKILQKTITFLLGFILIITPWITRNYLISGRAAVENPQFYIRILASGYVHSQDEIAMLPGESSEEYYSRMKHQIIEFIVDNPGEVAGFYASHFVHNEIGTILDLPLSFKFDSLYGYIHNFTFWKNPSNLNLGDSIMVFFLNLTVVSVGIGFSFQRMKWVGLSPLLIHLGYSLSAVPMRLSGWRFILPVDWVVLLYYGVGLIMLTKMIWAVFAETDLMKSEDRTIGVYATPVESKERQRIDFKTLTLVLVVPVLFGLSLPLIEIVTPAKYAKINREQIVTKYFPNEILLDDGTKLSNPDLLSFIHTERDAVILYGRALYPGFYKMGEFWGDQNPNLLAASQYDRLQFNVIGPNPRFVFIPLSQPPKTFPHASDVAVLGCSSSSGIRALLIRIPDQSNVLRATPWYGLTCSS